MPTITRGATVLTPLDVTGWRQSRPQTSVVHYIIGGDPVVTVRTAGPRAGTITTLWPTPAAAIAAEDALLTAGAAWVIDATDTVTGLSMTAHVLSTDCDVTTPDLCVLTLTVQEVAP